MHTCAIHQAFPASSLQSTDCAQTQATLLAMSCPAGPSCSGCQHFSNAGSRGAWCRGCSTQQGMSSSPGAGEPVPREPGSWKTTAAGASLSTHHTRAA